MNNEELLKHQEQERDKIKANIYDAQNRLRELEGIIAAIKEVIKISQEANTEEQ